MTTHRGIPVAIGLGSNVGDRLAHLRAAAAVLEQLLDAPRFSGVYETLPLDVTDQPTFLNACCVGGTELTPSVLMELLIELEREGGRSDGGIRFGPRVIDLDILLYGTDVVDTETLTIPHPRMHQRAFVLVPLAEVAPNWQHSGMGRSINELRSAVESDGVRPTDWALSSRDGDPGDADGG